MGNAEYMGTPQPTMAATQILVALCVVGSAVAAPQISLGRSRSAGTNINENQVVTSVITSLTPSISKAVEEALAAAAAAEQAAAEQAAAEQAAAEEAAAAAAEAERIKAAQAAQAEAARRQQIAAANAAAAAAAAEKNAFESQVADDEERTYISRNEERDGNELSGSYSFIDATGALVTVDYTAGVNGYAETRSKEAGKVTMKAVPAWDGPLAGLEEASGAVAVAKGSTSSSSRFGSSSGSRSSSSAISSGIRSSSAISSSSSQSDLIAKILAALTPQINSAVAAALA